MAGDWIKIEVATPDKPEVVQMSNILGIDQDAVVGKLIRLWIWGDQQTVDGNALSVTEMFIDRCTYCPGFASALRTVGWLDGRDSRLSIPNFARHNGKPAKQRANTQKRVKGHRETCNDDSVTNVLPEKRREESKKKTTSSKKFEPLKVELPETLANDKFRVAWSEWVAFRSEKKKPLLASTAGKQIKKFSTAGCDVAIAMIDRSIENGWTGLFELKDGANGKSQGSANGSESTVEREQRKLQEFFANGHDRPE